MSAAVVPPSTSPFAAADEVAPRQTSARRPRVTFLVNSQPQGAMGIRARSFATLLPDFDIQIVYRDLDKIRAIRTFLAALGLHRPESIYVFDMAFSGVLAGALYARLHGARLVIDTGDAISFLAESTGERSWLGRRLTSWLERASLAWADRLVVRSHFHREYLAAQPGSQSLPVDVIPDGVDLQAFAPVPAPRLLRETLGLGDCWTVGFVGSITWNERWQMCYGSELIAALARLPHLPVKGVVIGDGNGLVRLQEMARALNVTDRIVFLGRIAYEALPAYLRTIDFCLSTQTDDLAGQVRTTGKLPLYLAADRFVLSTRVGEAARVLPEAMLLDYAGTKDEAYPARLAARIEELITSGLPLEMAARLSPAIAREHFDYPLLAERLRHCLRALSAVSHSTGEGRHRR